MKIYTKTGDQGNTDLFGGKRVSKDDLRVEAYGNVDELNAFVGLLSDAIDQNLTLKQILSEIQCRLFSMGAYLAADPDGAFVIEHDLLLGDVALLEQEMDRMDQQLAPLSNFILPGGHSTVSVCHVCRTVSRRAERSMVSLHRAYPLDGLALQYINRLSDYFFVLSRSLAHTLGANEVIWKKRTP